ncbi:MULTISPECIES: bifunctional diaminohydroxyphosphoribosylaminopyrimidine deaminase/5-amino-6-(5-phosphoribosylamino)uracil reductase RibD [unclassified Sphingobium]|uniref:bifunctional diaminohydroxyphosphoribosylaminopyrimidine deaminase/5-amino-6-(5-phosphoribosylamino)uracil reductase RibD n=1 Tax=unclassified Sphingobium TaxID=2611147 RepID=UPI002224B221|nr:MULTISPECIES: bifunctional diaminohydroxyphosphoribosylaminopyrimidine deaminase/5-amino-6-(5-phosphoribosylamino)uracil reductase RibD [unclassified Sphingobium]MCW2396322.1 diaminohydroxyphosphoribosylaminopyrimidine deaminase/5-amino-6-(5-phosphoribosylamino)uracil reductase [Sphingobium sp. B8D3B]MCW2419838.1 diaminohydroxyphosphoribosylaminopyrimidine deaminase/5-amino-6-(5-phosphoribosylamino)uracil reductase [Sphingobium sp. B8D3C]
MAAIALSHRSRGRTAPNPNVGCIMLDAAGRVVGRGWTQHDGRPHAEAMALAMAGASARGGTAYVSLEPCAHPSARGPCCSDLLVEAGVRRVVVAAGDPDPRTNGRGMARLRDAGLTVEALPELASRAREAMAGFFTRQRAARPHVTLKLATSLDGCIAQADGTSQWITGPAARAHTHLERARHELILVGRGTLTQDQPRLDVRLPGLEARSPVRVLLSHSGAAPDGWLAIQTPAQIAGLPGDHLMVEGGAQTAGAFLAADLVDRLLLYRAPILIGRGKAALGDIGLNRLADAHGRWRLVDARNLAPDRLEVYERVRPA